MITSEQKKIIIETAYSCLGTPYIYGTSPEKAPAEFDCSSFTQYLYKMIGIIIPRSTILQAGDKNSTEIIIDKNYLNLEKGDLLFMRGSQGYYNDALFPDREIYIGHVGIYVGDENIIHARQSLGCVAIQKISELIAIPKFSIILVKRY